MMNTDVWIPRLIVASVTAIGMTAMIGSTVLASPPTWFQSVAVGSLTGLLAYLVPSPLSRKE